MEGAAPRRREGEQVRRREVVGVPRHEPRGAEQQRGGHESGVLRAAIRVV